MEKWERSKDWSSRCQWSMSIQYATHSFRMCLDYENDMNGIWHFYTIVEQQYAQESVLEWTGVLVLAWWHFNNSADKECKCFCLCSKIDQHKLTRGCFFACGCSWIVLIFHIFFRAFCHFMALSMVRNSPSSILVFLLLSVDSVTSNMHFLPLLNT